MSNYEPGHGPGPIARIAANAARHWTFLLSMAFVVAVLVFVVATLRNSSLWLDELMSLYYSDPAHADAGELWQRMSSDLHPPGYYVLLYVWREILGSSIVSVRFLSVTLMTVVLVIYIRHVATEFGLRVAAVCAPLAVVSQVFLVYAQEVRSYPLLMLLCLCTAIVYQRACRHEWSFPAALALLSGLCFLTETLHPYGVLWAGAVCGGLLIFRKSLKERAAVAGVGALLLIYPIARLAWMSELAADNYNWFAYLNPVVELLFGISRPLIIREDWWIVLLALVPLAWWLRTRQVDWAILGRALPLTLLVPFVIVPALAVHFFIEPSFNDRNIGIVSPVFWLLVPYAVAAVSEKSLNYRIVAAAIGLICINHVAHAGWMVSGFKSEWRHSAQFVDRYFSDCRDTPLPVFAYVDAERDRYFYEYYLANEFEFRFVDRTDLDGALASAAANDCPIKFWAPHGLSPDAVARRQELERLGYKTVTFDHTAQWKNTPLQGAFVIVPQDLEVATD